MSYILCKFYRIYKFSTVSQTSKDQVSTDTETIPEYVTTSDYENITSDDYTSSRNLETTSTGYTGIYLMPCSFYLRGNLAFLFDGNCFIWKINF